MAIYGLFPDPDSAQSAVDSLGRLGPGLNVKDEDILVVSSEPFAHHEFGRRGHKTLMPWLAALGGLIGGLSIYWFVSYSQRAYPLPTGNMKIVPLWPDGIIIYECTMLGAILAALITLMVTARLRRSTRQIYDPQVADGKILVGVLYPAEASRPALERALREAGAASVVSRP